MSQPPLTAASSFSLVLLALLFWSGYSKETSESWAGEFPVNGEGKRRRPWGVYEQAHNSKAVLTENEHGSGKRKALEHQEPTARQACKTGDVILQETVQMSTNDSPVLAPLGCDMAAPCVHSRALYSFAHWVWVGYGTQLGLMER